MKLKIKSRTLSEWIFWFTILATLLVPGTHSFFKTSGSIKFIVDAGIIATAFLIFTSRIKLDKWSKRILVYVAIFFGYMLISYLFNYQNILYFIWGTRNNFRFFVFLILCIIKLSENEVEYYEKFFDILFWINAAFCTVEFITGNTGDNLGGLFGITTGCNANLNIFLVIMTTRTIITYLNRKISAWYLIAVLICTAYIAALSELKFLFIEIPIIVISAILITNFTYRKLFIVVMSILTAILGIYILIQIFPDWKDSFTLEKLMEMGTTEEGYTGSNDLNRLNAIQTISKRILKTREEELFGIGLGNADHSSSITVLKTAFYKKYKALHYSWFSTAIMYIEGGIVGLCIYEGFFVYIIVQCRKIKKYHPQATVQAQTAIIIAIVCFVITIYNNSLRTEPAYMVYLFFALPFCKLKTSADKQLSNNSKIKIHF